MTRFRIGAGLLAALLAVCVWSQIKMAGIQTPIAHSVAQAEQLAYYEKTASMHFALEYRGDRATAQKYLDAQAQYFIDHPRGRD